MIVYISGPISDVESYKEKFMKAEEYLRERGYETINPALIPMPNSVNYDQILKVDMTMLEAAQGIYMLKGWQSSNGAKTELAYAISRGLKIMVEI